MIDLDQDAGLWVLRINRPAKANSLTKAMLEALVEKVEAAAVEAKAMIITGAGDKVFSAGADLDEAKAGLATDPVWERLSRAVAETPVPTIAALNGTLAGGAFGMVLACDMRLSVSFARFFYPVAALGFLPQPSDPGRLAELIGPARAKMILVAGQKIDAEEALHWGLVDRIVSHGPVLDAARSMLEPVLQADRAHITAIKHMIR